MVTNPTANPAEARCLPMRIGVFLQLCSHDLLTMLLGAATSAARVLMSRALEYFMEEKGFPRNTNYSRWASELI